MVGDMPKGSMAHPLLKGGKRRDLIASSSNRYTYIRLFFCALLENSGPQKTQVFGITQVFFYGNSGIFAENPNVSSKNASLTG